MIAAVSFDLVPEAEVLDRWQFALWMLLGVGVFLLGDSVVERRFGSEGTGGAMGIVVGSIVDGVPESLILGIQVGAGLGDQPELRRRGLRLQPAAGDRALGQPPRLGVGPEEAGRPLARRVLACGVAAALGFFFTDVTADVQGDRAAALAAGGILAMLTNSLVPFSFERGGALAGAATAVGFCAAVLNS